MKHLLFFTLIFSLLTACEVQPESAASATPVKPPFTVLQTVTGPANHVGIRRVVHTVLIDSSSLSKIETVILPSLVKKYDDRNYNQFFIYSENPVNIHVLRDQPIIDVYRAAKKGSIALINSAADDGTVLYEY